MPLGHTVTRNQPRGLLHIARHVCFQFGAPGRGKRSSIVEISVSRFFFWRKSRNFFLFGVSRVFFRRKFFFGLSHVNFFFWRKSRMGKKNPFSQKKKRRGNTRTTQQPPLLPEEVKHIAPTDILGTSGTGKAMEPWREGWFLYSSPADGGNNVRHMAEITWSTLIMTANKKCNLPFGLWQAVSK